LNSKLELNILWLNNKIGVGIDQLQSGEKIPLTKYFFWPKTDAWDQIKSELETKPWIENSKKIELLDNITTIINRWQSTNSNTSTLMKKPIQ
tara:strand:+ start:846 stop:1121 length:276 start_codon:yes stop_codon:yes gene_type:complete